MTHIGKERLLERSFLSKFAGFFHLLFPMLEIVNIHKHTIRFYKLALLIANTLGAYLIPVPLSITIEVGLYLT